MMCYKDRTYCPYYLICKTWQHGECDKAATPKIILEAQKWTKTITPKNVILISLYSKFPECFVRWFE